MMQNSRDGAMVELSADEKKSLANVIKTFNLEYPLQIIETYMDNFIVFSVIDYPFGVVYSEDGSVPDSLDSPSRSDYNFKINKLIPNWYTVEDKMD